MRIVTEHPPNFDDICKVFPSVRTNNNVLFCWGETLYNPSGGNISDSIMAHEELHSLQQKHGKLSPSSWWEKYLWDLTFRYDQELAAHAEEYLHFCKTHKDRNQQNLYLNLIGNRLAGPLYGNMVKVYTAIKNIRECATDSRIKPVYISKESTESITAPNPVADEH